MDSHQPNSFFLALVCGIVGLALGMPGQAGAEQVKRGLITSAECPYSCISAGLPADTCRDWRKFDRCFVEDLTQAPGHRTLARLPQGSAPAAPQAGSKSYRDPNQTGTWVKIPKTDFRPQDSGGNAQLRADGPRGLVTSAACPYSCKAANLSPDVCREWRTADTCYVEDLTQAPGHRTLARLP